MRDKACLIVFDLQSSCRGRPTQSTATGIRVMHVPVLKFWGYKTRVQIASEYGNESCLWDRPRACPALAEASQCQRVHRLSISRGAVINQDRTLNVLQCGEERIEHLHRTRFAIGTVVVKLERESWPSIPIPSCYATGSGIFRSLLCRLFDSVDFSFTRKRIVIVSS